MCEEYRCLLQQGIDEMQSSSFPAAEKRRRDDTAAMNADAQKIADISREVFSQVRTTIVLNMRFLDMAVFRLHPIPENMTLATDGNYLYYHPLWLLKRYQQESNAVNRDYLHVLMHCIFRHPFVHSLIDQPLWDLACDIAVEAMICSLGQKHFATKAEVQRSKVISSLEAKVHPLTAEKLYNWFSDHEPKASWPRLFHADEHDLWYNPGQAQQMASRARQKQNQQQDDPSSSERKGNRNNNTSGQSPDHDNQPQSDPQDSHDDSGSGTPLEQEWRDISDHVQMDLESFGKQRGENAGGMQQMLAQINREKYDYEAFLKKFAVMGEVMKINDDEFDYIFYTYGLKLFKSMPLIEPLEYKEVKRIREFVIAIDTSGSTSGELVQKFLTKTWNILQSTESFFSKVNIHIVQCDAVIQETVKITTKEEFEQYIQTMTIRGLGGTDFRPVFSYVDQLIRQHEFKHLKGMIYFTDGMGTFPERKPDYTTAFVFIQDKYNNLNVPPWAIKLILEKDEL